MPTVPPEFCIGEPSVVLIVDRVVLPAVCNADVAAPEGSGREDTLMGTTVPPLMPCTVTTEAFGEPADPVGTDPPLLPPPPAPVGNPAPPEMLSAVAPAVSMPAR